MAGQESERAFLCWAKWIVGRGESVIAVVYDDINGGYDIRIGKFHIKARNWDSSTLPSTGVWRQLDQGTRLVLANEIDKVHEGATKAAIVAAMKRVCGYIEFKHNASKWEAEPGVKVVEVEENGVVRIQLDKFPSVASERNRGRSYPVKISGEVRIDAGGGVGGYAMEAETPFGVVDGLPFIEGGDDDDGDRRDGEMCLGLANQGIQEAITKGQYDLAVAMLLGTIKKGFADTGYVTVMGWMGGSPAICEAPDCTEVTFWYEPGESGGDDAVVTRFCRNCVYPCSCGKGRWSTERYSVRFELVNGELRAAARCWKCAVFCGRCRICISSGKACPMCADPRPVACCGCGGDSLPTRALLARRRGGPRWELWHRTCSAGRPGDVCFVCGQRRPAGPGGVIVSDRWIHSGCLDLVFQPSIEGGSVRVIGNWPAKTGQAWRVELHEQELEAAAAKAAADGGSGGKADAVLAAATERGSAGTGTEPGEGGHVGEGGSSVRAVPADTGSDDGR